MKRLWALAAAFAALSGTAFANDGQISRRDLAKMGLSEMKTLSDAQGMQVRGTFVIATSNTFVSGPSLNIVNFHISNGSTFAASGKVTVGIGVIAGGFSTASAH